MIWSFRSRKLYSQFFVSFFLKQRYFLIQKWNLEAFLYKEFLSVNKILSQFCSGVFNSFIVFIVYVCICWMNIYTFQLIVKYNQLRNWWIIFTLSKTSENVHGILFASALIYPALLHGPHQGTMCRTLKNKLFWKSVHLSRLYSQNTCYENKARKECSISKMMNFQIYSHFLQQFGFFPIYHVLNGHSRCFLMRWAHFLWGEKIHRVPWVLMFFQHFMQIICPFWKIYRKIFLRHPSVKQ